MLMSRRTLTHALLTASILPFLVHAAQAAARDDGCEAAISAATMRHHLPQGVLQAIAETESGRYDPGTGARVPWPWTVTAGGTGRFFATRDDAVAHVRDLWLSGITSIDVGCLQVNLHYHPTAFATLEQAFDPSTNADYAAAFLVALHRPNSDWSGAIADYHSADPVEGIGYLRRVMLNLSEPAAVDRTPRLMEAALVVPALSRFGITVITPGATGLSPRHPLPPVITP